MISNTEPSFEKCRTFLEKITSLCIEKGNPQITVSDYTDFCEILATSANLFDFRSSDLELLCQWAQIFWDNLYFVDYYNTYSSILNIIFQNHIQNYPLEIHACWEAGKGATRLARYEDAVSHSNAV